MRPLARALGLCALLVGADALGAHGGERSVAVSPVSAPESLGIFAPEVTRALVEALVQAGVDVQPGGARIDGRIDVVDTDHVRLWAGVAGRTVEAVGALEQIDVLTSELAARILAALPSTVRRSAAHGAIHRPSLGHASLRPVEAPPVPSLPSLPSVSAPPTGRPEEPPRLPEAAPAPLARKEEPAIPTPPPTPLPPSSEPVASRAEVSPAPPVATARVPLRTEAAATATPSPAQPPAHPEDSPTAIPVLPAASASDRHDGRPPRVLLRSVRLQGSCEQSGAATTEAREALNEHGVADVVRGGCGIGPVEAVFAEAGRAGAGALVMADVSGVKMAPDGSGHRAAGQVRVVVVRDGKLAVNVVYPLTSRVLDTADPVEGARALSSLAFDRLGESLARAILR